MHSSIMYVSQNGHIQLVILKSTHRFAPDYKAIQIFHNIDRKDTYHFKACEYEYLLNLARIFYLGSCMVLAIC